MARVREFGARNVEGLMSPPKTTTDPD
jgi:hypothetical protein